MQIMAPTAAVVLGSEILDSKSRNGYHGPTRNSCSGATRCGGKAQVSARTAKAAGMREGRGPGLARLAVDGVDQRPVDLVAEDALQGQRLAAVVPGERVPTLVRGDHPQRHRGAHVRRELLPA